MVLAEPERDVGASMARVAVQRVLPDCQSGDVAGDADGRVGGVRGAGAPGSASGGLASASYDVYRPGDDLGTDRARELERRRFARILDAFLRLAVDLVLAHRRRGPAC